MGGCTHQLKRNRRSLLQKYGNCCYCGESLTRDTATLEHLVPKAVGGKTSIQNVDIACSNCNFLFGRLFAFVRGTKRRLEKGYKTETGRIADMHDLFLKCKKLNFRRVNPIFEEFSTWDSVMELIPKQLIYDGNDPNTNPFPLGYQNKIEDQ